MTSQRPLDKRVLKVKYWDQEQRFVDRHKLAFEAQIKHLSALKLEQIQNLSELDPEQCDLLVIAMGSIPEDKIPQWLSGLKSRLMRTDTIWIPVLLFARLSFPLLADILRTAVDENWYFDVISPDHMDSLPIRVANLIRIREHLSEMKRYARALEDLEEQVANLGAALGDGPIK